MQVTQEINITMTVIPYANPHATFTKGTIEFRLFQFDQPAEGRKQNGLHAGQLKATYNFA